MDNINVDIALQEWADGVVKTAKKNLAKQGKNTSKKLSNSIKAEANNGTLIFYFEEYGIAVDTGRNGTQKKRNSNSIFGQPAKAAFPNVSAIKKWIKRKPVTLKGNKMTIDSMAYVIGRSIKLKGIKASLFFSKPFITELPGLGEAIAKAFANDLDETLNNK